MPLLQTLSSMLAATRHTPDLPHLEGKIQKPKKAKVTPALRAMMVKSATPLIAKLQQGEVPHTLHAFLQTMNVEILGGAFSSAEIEKALAKDSAPALLDILTRMLKAAKVNLEALGTARETVSEATIPDGSIALQVDLTVQEDTDSADIWNFAKWFERKARSHKLAEWEVIDVSRRRAAADEAHYDVYLSGVLSKDVPTTRKAVADALVDAIQSYPKGGVLWTYKRDEDGELDLSHYTAKSILSGMEVVESAGEDVLRTSIAEAAGDGEDHPGQKMVFGQWRDVDGDGNVKPAEDPPKADPKGAEAKPAKAPKKKRPTFDAAKGEILGDLEKKGWKVQRGLKVPHATSPDGKTRFYFKAQAVYAATTDNGKLDLGNARSTHGADIRDIEPGDFLKHHKELHGDRRESLEIIGTPTAEAAATVYVLKNHNGKVLARHTDVTALTKEMLSYEAQTGNKTPISVETSTPRAT